MEYAWLTPSITMKSNRQLWVYVARLPKVFRHHQQQPQQQRKNQIFHVAPVTE